MLYLAEVQKQKSGFGLGGGRSELKLLACQRSESNWVAVPGDDVVPAEDASGFKEGALVLVDLNAGKQVQRIQEASRQLVSILQEFSRLQEKFKTQQEEIEQWKESLTYQSQELNRREMEMEAQREQVEQLETEFERLEQQRQEVTLAQEEGSRLRAELEQARQEIATTQNRLQAQIQELESKQAELKTSATVSYDQAQVLQEALTQIAPISLELLQGQIQRAQEKLQTGQTLLQTYWQQLQEKQAAVHQAQQETQSLYQALQSQRQTWNAAQTTLTQTQVDFKAKQSQLQAQQNSKQLLQVQIQAQQALIQHLERLSTQVGQGGIAVTVDTQMLESMPIEQLKGDAEKLRQEWEKGTRLVGDEEEELKSKQEEITALQERIQHASAEERSQLEEELADEQDAYEMLNRTIEGQLRTLREREAILNQYQVILGRRQGQPSNLQPNGPVTFALVLSSVIERQQQHQQELQASETDIQTLQRAIAQDQDTLNRQISEQQQQRQAIEAQEQAWVEKSCKTAELLGQVALYQEILQPTQNYWDELRQQIEGATAELNQLTTSKQQQTQQVEQLRQTLATLVSV
ncbi:MAG: pilus motility taxis protein HmpF [Microcoleaceae cyanobacterium]